MADDAGVVDLRMLQRQLADLRLYFGRLEARQNDQGRDIKLLLTMAQNLDEAVKDLGRQMGDLIGAVSGRLGALEERL
jgi:Tfp pilus assembly protein PilF